MSILTKMIAQLDQLPADAQLQVADFVEFLAQKNETKECLKLSSDERRSLEKCLGISPTNKRNSKREAVLVG
ncbi:hypothetical protein [uncultured Microscilla sp.]|uniref:hypothetical protein n=1 Tax=uncultured Microscilla sp. TaxID=432653 RepID=UPI00261220AD|nr:hypothetical protein [uncultured Microscilla sp.]